MLHIIKVLQSYLPNALNKATISVLVNWKSALKSALTVESSPILLPENRIFKAVPIPRIWGKGKAICEKNFIKQKQKEQNEHWEQFKCLIVLLISLLNDDVHSLIWFYRKSTYTK